MPTVTTNDLQSTLPKKKSLFDLLIEVDQISIEKTPHNSIVFSPLKDLSDGRL